MRHILHPVTLSVIEIKTNADENVLKKFQVLKSGKKPWLQAVGIGFGTEKQSRDRLAARGK